ncbi:DUF2092 domain-containing protein [Lysobacter cavernae]|uniref:DUF2092 domain-containing protein n=1 Tax=Lysobacter cavernae TaxID=1685901 RepID=A0ABV7RND2_9GAMM
MLRIPPLTLALGITLLAIPLAHAQSAPAAAPSAASAAIEPQAVAALERMSAYLRKLKGFTLTGTTSIEYVMDDGQKYLFPGTVEYRTQLPDRLYGAVRSEQREREFFYDGKTFTLSAPKLGYYASVPAAGNVDALLRDVHSRYGLEMPLADLFWWGTDSAPVSAIRAASVVGPAKIDGRDCTQYAFRQAGADWQVWIQSGDQPLPRKLVITSTGDAARPQYVAQLDWNSATPSATSFRFTAPKGAHPIVIQEIEVAASRQETAP